MGQMKILYGVQATGNGHISRSREMITALKSSGHCVEVIFSGRDENHLWDVEIFKPFTAYKGITFAVTRGRIDPLKTLKNLSLTTFLNDIRGFDAKGYDLVISDFEPISSRIAKRCKIPSIGIGHQYAFNYKIPVKGFDPVARLVLNHFAPVDFPLGLHWHHFNQPILPPIIPEMSPDKVKTEPNNILVYLPFEARQEVLEFLKGSDEHTFHYYTAVDKQTVLGNITLKPFSRQGFLDDLISCEGVVSNAGFELASEALHLGKKILAKPLAGQYEQIANGLALEKLGSGTVMKTLSRDALKHWLKAPAPKPVSYPNVARLITNWIEKKQWGTFESFAKETWKGVQTGVL